MAWRRSGSIPSANETNRGGSGNPKLIGWYDPNKSFHDYIVSDLLRDIPGISGRAMFVAGRSTKTDQFFDRY